MPSPAVTETAEATPTPTIEEEVSEAYLRYWDVYSEGLFDLETSRNHVSFTVVKPDGRRREVGGHHIRLYTLREMRGALDAAELTYEAVHGGFEGETYGIGTRRMIIVAHKPA